MELSQGRKICTTWALMWEAIPVMRLSCTRIKNHFIFNYADRYVGRALNIILGTEISIPENPDIVGAMGAALIAGESQE